MPSYEKRSGSWRVVVSYKGQKLSATFPTKSEATHWATSIEADLRARKLGICADKSVSDVLDKYEKEVSINKRGYRWESVRIGLLKRLDITSVRLEDLDSTHVAKWRDDRLKAVSGSSVNREWNLLSHAIEIARKEWKWCHENPFKGQVTRPVHNAARTKVFSDAEVAAICLSMGSAGLSGKVKDCFLLALETAMRAGEICTIQKENMYGNYVHLDITKNGDSRDVPLSAKAQEILKKYPDGFGLTSEQVSYMFRRGCKLAGVEGKTFHDSRHTATTNLAKKLPVMELAKMTGHKDLKMLMRYYHPSAKDISAKL